MSYDDDLDDYYHEVYIPVVITVCVILVAKLIFWLLFCLCWYQPRQRARAAAMATSPCVPASVYVGSSSSAFSSQPHLSSPTAPPAYCGPPPAYSQVGGPTHQGQITGVDNRGFTSPGYPPAANPPYPEYK